MGQWVHIVGDGTSRDMYRLIKALLSAAETARTTEESTMATVAAAAAPALEWWQRQMYGRILGSTRSISKFSLGYGEKAAMNMASKMLWVYRYRGVANTSLTWAPFRDTPAMRKTRTDPISRLGSLSIKPDAVVISLSTLKLCEMPTPKFLVYVADYIKHVKATYTGGGRVVWLLPPAVHDLAYHERFRTCSYQKIKQRADILQTKLAGAYEFVNLWEMTAARPDATSEGSRYVWATKPEAMREDTDSEAMRKSSLLAGVDGFRGPVGWSMANMVLNRLCAGALNPLSGDDLKAAEMGSLDSVFQPLTSSGARAQHSTWVRTTMLVGAFFGLCIMAFAAVIMWIARGQGATSKRLV